MGKRRRREGDSGGPAAAEYDTVFIDTSLGTRLATTIPTSFTVSDVKRKIVVEHLEVYPGMGEIEIVAIQVQHQGCFYALADSMTFASAYLGSTSTPYKSVFIEASCDEEVAPVEPQVQSRSNAVGDAAEPCVEYTSQGELLSLNATSLPEAHNLSLLLDHLDPVANRCGVSHGSKNNMEVVGVHISSVGESSKCRSIAMNVAADSDDTEKDRSNIVKMDRSVAADLLVQSEATKTKVGVQTEENKAEPEDGGVLPIAGDNVITPKGLKSGKKGKANKSTPVDPVAEQAGTLTQDASEKKKKKRKRSHSSAVSTSGMKEPLTPIQDVTDRDLDGSAREVHQKNGSSSMKKEKKKRNKDQMSRAQNATNSEIKQNTAEAGEALKSTNSLLNGLVATTTEAPLNGRPETGMNDESKVAEEEIDFLSYFMPSEGNSASASF